MRLAIILLLDLLTSAALAEEPAIVHSKLLRVPELSPQLTKEEVSEDFTPWVDRISKMVAEWKSESTAAMIGARNALAPSVPKVTGITLYSLFPLDGSNIRSHEPERADELETLPRFHDFPVLGQLKIDDAAQANQWVDFLRDQIIPGGNFACDFMPRHGFRLTTPTGDLDILMCYSCDQLAFFGSSKPDNTYNPVFSHATETLLNRLFDKLRIKRDEPPKHKN
jgi:hypothetical protein